MSVLYINNKSGIELISADWAYIQHYIGQLETAFHEFFINFAKLWAFILASEIPLKFVVTNLKLDNIKYISYPESKIYQIDCSRL